MLTMMIHPAVRKVLAAAFLAAVFCVSAAQAKVKIVTTVFPLEEFARAVAGDRGDVSLLLPPGASVHTWQPRPGDILGLTGSDLLVCVGADLEPWLPAVLSALPQGRMRVLEASKGLALIPAAAEGLAEEPGHGHEHGAYDPHIWLDFDLDSVVVDHIASALAEFDPAGAAVYRGNADSLKARLATLDAAYRKGLSGCPGRRLVLAGHAAFGYLARRYGLTQTSLYGLSPDAQPNARTMTAIVDLCRAEKIRAVFREASDPPGPASTLAAEIRGRVLLLNPGHNLTRAEIRRGVGFFDLMEENLKAIREGLGCR
jgi:zinc transport system substrate-binding protein